MKAVRTMSKSLPHAKITLRRSAARGHTDLDWLNSYHTFSMGDYYDPAFMSFGCLRVLNEDHVAPKTGFPTHPHRDAEIFSYILSGELTHRDSTVKKGFEDSTANTNGGGHLAKKRDDFSRLHRNDVQFTTGGKGIAHSEQNESNASVHFLQIWATPWKRGLTPRYHTQTFSEEAKRKGFVPILSPLRARMKASEQEEEQAIPTMEGTIPVHADFMMGAGIVGLDKRFRWVVGGEMENGGSVVESKEGRRVYVHLPMTKNGSAKVRLDGREGAVLGEGDGAFVEGVRAGDVLSVESIGEAEAEVVVLDSN